MNQTPQITPSSIDTTMLPQHSWTSIPASLQSLQNHSQIQAHLQPSYEAQTPAQVPLSPPGTIDPRWVSPLSSLWSTPAGTPRGGSPVTPAPGHSAIPSTHNGQTFHPPNELSFRSAQSMGAMRYGTQSYPPRVVERRQLESPPMAIFGENHAGFSFADNAFQPSQDVKPMVELTNHLDLSMGPPSLPNFGSALINGTGWYQ